MVPPAVKATLSTVTWSLPGRGSTREETTNLPLLTTRGASTQQLVPLMRAPSAAEYLPLLTILDPAPMFTGTLPWLSIPLMMRSPESPFVADPSMLLNDSGPVVTSMSRLPPVQLRLLVTVMCPPVSETPSPSRPSEETVMSSPRATCAGALSVRLMMAWSSDADLPGKVCRRGRSEAIHTTPTLHPHSEMSQSGHHGSSGGRTLARVCRV